MPRHHVIISGTGRAGTTFLVQLLTALGLDTGFTDPHSGIHANCDAGMELDLLQANAPYIVKSPWLCDRLDEVLQAGDVIVDHALVPVRDLFAAAESRRRVWRDSDPAAFAGIVPGSLWQTDDPDAQEQALTTQLYKLIHALARHDVPTTLLYFPRFIHEPDYLFRKLTATFGLIRRSSFERAFRQVVRPELVHSFERPCNSLT